MNAFIIYDQFMFAARANSVLQSACRHSREPEPCPVSAWEMLHLKFPRAAGEALAEAVQAHLVIVAIGGELVCAAWLVQWLVEWATRRQVAEAGLALLCDRPSGLALEVAARDLSRLAKRHGLDFIFEENFLLAGASSVCPLLLSERRLLPPQTLPRHLGVSGPKPWTINDAARF